MLPPSSGSKNEPSKKPASKEMASRAQFTTLFYSSTNLLAGLNLNIPVNTRERFRLTDFGPFCLFNFRLV
jgi:hypothetical protein